MKNNQKGLTQILLAVGIVALVGFIGYMLYLQKQEPEITVVPSAYQADYQKAGETVVPVENSSDLDSASKGLDAEDTTKIDAELNLLNSASSGF